MTAPTIIAAATVERPAARRRSKIDQPLIRGSPRWPRSPYHPSWRWKVIDWRASFHRRDSSCKLFVKRLRARQQGPRHPHPASLSRPPQHRQVHRAVADAVQGLLAELNPNAHAAPDGAESKSTDPRSRAGSDGRNSARTILQSFRSTLPRGERPVPPPLIRRRPGFDPPPARGASEINHLSTVFDAASIERHVVLRAIPELDEKRESYPRFLLTSPHA